MSDRTSVAWIGGYTSGGNDLGVSALTAPTDGGDPADALLRASASSPSWLALHPDVPVLYAAEESAGTLAAFRIEGTDLTPVGSAPAGDIVCHLLVRASHLIACCYGDGVVLRVELDEQGNFAQSVPAVPSVDPHAADGARQSRAHCAADLDADHIVTADLGHDQLRFFSTRDGLEQIGTVTLPMGSGPRHLLVHHQSRVSVITEYSCRVHTVERGADGQWHPVSEVPLLEGEVPPDAAGAELNASADGSVIYAGVRGPDLIVTLDAAASRVLGRTSSGGRWPRHHRQLGSRLLVANQLSDEISVLEIDPTSGVPGAAVGSISTPAPAHILPVGSGPQR